MQKLSPTKNKMKFSEKLKSERLRLGLSQAGLAAVLEVSKSAVEKWEYGTKEPIEIAKEGALARLRRRKARGD